MASKKTRKRLAWGVLAFCVVGWPVTMLTPLGQHEPPLTFSLSWLALILTAVLIVIEV